MKKRKIFELIKASTASTPLSTSTLGFNPELVPSAAEGLILSTGSPEQFKVHAL